ncbi:MULTISPECIES: ABC transporter ATP-binding protein [unclassified Shinella]|jgi:spermidine/putrescine transport system ATP-binding protein|uniref:ABC transporter ATP-binding protein n=1 Tax=unclassified Shinella TaxID=2643062 RepID=UPI000680E2AC|nr:MULTISPECIES: ABC transporter ATP-binding protein [unclassified Shinella]KNY13017.1 spermidine/putrescine ABC transporter ATP-binding protein [Shinella sp. SUS2]KOC71749.1 spermidine/putrescine ABC transporter ATP-binding protein [Shinella sp. GWS1]MCO5153958.1 ABC transporter ATP-binding protein [Shinella sp.]MDC7262819.1 ABC transporter ATP-binding protein [Shinella sp. HY16]MDC7269714.1 ABC transporter ATP-binding protein [Shinella sp. YZ44]
MEPVVQFDNVTKSYGGYVAVENLNLSIEPGKFVTLLGPSGCGKSTSLRMLGGFETPTSGRILLSGKDVTRVPPNKRNVNIVFQDYALFPHMTVAKNIAFGLELKGLDNARIHRRVCELLELVQLQDYAKRLPAELSGGQRQRVALMRALAPDPDVLLLDEPLSALDAKLRQQMQIELKAIQEKTGKTFMFVTHDQEEALTMSDTIVVMNKGRIEQMGDPNTLYGRPGSVFVANFIGETNLLRSAVLGFEDGVAALNWNGVTIKANPGGLAPKVGDNLYVVLRPEAIHCSASEPATANRIKGKIRQRVFKGNHTSMMVQVGDGALLNTLVHPSEVEQLDGEDVWLGWKPETATVIPDRRANT